MALNAADMGAKDNAKRMRNPEKLSALNPRNPEARNPKPITVTLV